ncbi:hypothetical protein GE300_00390 [Rhodobacteraceae bacterium 2CG4]|uniref:Phage MuF C-terminal domain-containing protein n=1 Tax=Halovulum marinum TaxID=2662447 RepID=A0A6L5YUW0_9RHOB|nr:hypothetical protein [Halovulum marinum]MSU88071.1 hypothetical protein [Halovulum marinum]
MIDLLQGRLDPSASLTLGPVPEILRRLGGHGQDVVMSGGKLKAVIQKHKRLQEKTLLNLPQLLADPVMVLRSPGDNRTGDLRLVLDDLSKDGEIVVASVKLRGAKPPSGEKATVLLTVHPADQITAKIEKAVRSGKSLVRYVRAEPEAGKGGFKHTGVNSLNAPLSGTVSLLRVKPNMLTPKSDFKDGKPPHGFAEPAPGIVRAMRKRGEFRFSVGAVSGWKKDVIDLLQGRLDPSASLTLGPVPEILRRLGGRGNNMVMQASKLQKVMKEHGRNLRPQTLVDLPQLLANPVMILTNVGEGRAGDFRLLLDTPSTNDQIVVAAIRLKGSSATGDAATVVLTVHEETDTQAEVRRAVRSGKNLVRYVRGEPEGGTSGYKHTGANSLNAPLRGTIDLLRVKSNMLTPRSVFKDGKPPQGFAEDEPRFALNVRHRPKRQQGQAHQGSAMGATLSIPDRRVWEELRARNVALWSRLGNAGGAVDDHIDKARIKLQDRFLPVLRAQQAVMRATGASLPKNQDAHVAETTFSGKVGRHLFEIDQDFAKPIIDMIAATRGRLTVADVGTYLYARHAEERDKQIARINPKMPDGGSGMTAAEARKILADFRAGPHAQTLDDIADLIHRLRERTMQLRLDAGLITPAEAAMWRTQYDFYVPLKGFAETDNTEAVLDATGVGRRFSTRGQESKRALGRGSEAFNPLVAALTRAQEVAIRAEKNRLGQALHRLIEANPAPAMWEVKKPKQTRYFNRTTGMVETRAEDPVSLVMDPNEMAGLLPGIWDRVLRTARAAAARTLCLLWKRSFLDGTARLGNRIRASGAPDAP